MPRPQSERERWRVGLGKAYLLLRIKSKRVSGSLVMEGQALSASLLRAAAYAWHMYVHRVPRRIASTFTV